MNISFEISLKSNKSSKRRKISKCEDNEKLQFDNQNAKRKTAILNNVITSNSEQFSKAKKEKQKRR